MSHHAPFSICGWARRAISMSLLWLGLGALVGILSAPTDGGIIGFVAGAMAGMIVLPPVGAMFGLLGGRWRESLGGAACGLVSGIAIAMVSRSTQLAASVSLQLLLGAFAGATLPQMCRLYFWIARQALSQLRSFRTECTGISTGSTVPEDGAINPYR